MVKSKTLKNKSSVAIFIKLAKKYGVTQSGSKKQIAERLSGLRGCSRCRNCIWCRRYARACVPCVRATARVCNANKQKSALLT